jgi:hypothetical protein
VTSFKNYEKTTHLFIDRGLRSWACVWTYKFCLNRKVTHLPPYMSPCVFCSVYWTVDSNLHICILRSDSRPPLWSSGQSSWLHKGDVLCFLWGTNWIYICYVEESRPPLWSSCQSFWLHNGDVLCFLWGTNWIYTSYVEESRPPLWSSGQSSWVQNGDELCFLWGMNWIYICYAEESRPPLSSSG